VPDLEKLYPRVAFQPRTGWDAANTGINEGLTKLLAMLKEEKASITQTRTDNGTAAEFSNLTSKDLPK
jgi:hypothetical protein